MPCTGGGATTKICASWIDGQPAVQLLDDAVGRQLRDRGRASGMSSSTTKIAPALGALVKVAPEKPTMFTALETPGVFSAISTARRLTSSVRASAEPGGNCVTMIRKPRSTAGMKPVGVLRNSLRPKAMMPT